MTTAIVQRSVSFYGDELVAIQQGETTYTPVKPVCDILGIDWESQRQRIARDEVLSEGACMIQVPSAGGPQQMLCLPVDYLHGWLFGVDVARIRPELRERLILYKRECYRVLSQAFSGGGLATQSELAELRARVEALEGQRRPRREPKPRQLPAPRPVEEKITAVLARKGQALTARQVAVNVRGLSSAEARQHLDALAASGEVATEPSKRTVRFSAVHTCRPVDTVDL